MLSMHQYAKIFKGEFFDTACEDIILETFRLKHVLLSAFTLRSCYKFIDA